MRALVLIVGVVGFLIVCLLGGGAIAAAVIIFLRVTGQVP